MLLSYLNHSGTNCVLSCQVIWDSFATHMDCGPPGSSVQGIFQARTLQWVAISSTRGSSSLRVQTHDSCASSIGRSDQIRSVAQSCPTLCDPMNLSMPGLPVHHQLPKFTQTHVHRVSDAIQLSHPLSSPSLLAPQSLPASESFPMSQLFA